ncbi:unnamed protein product [Rhizopus stolonifer]
MKKFLKSLNSFDSASNKERRYINIYKYILEIHLYKDYLFKLQNVKAYSEQDFIIKFWSYVFEEAFSNSGLYLHWGDTKSTTAKKNIKIDMKIDLRILFCSNTKRSDLSGGEFAKKAIPSKLYNDKLKQVTISKYHLNTFLLSGLPPQQLQSQLSK